MRGGTRETTTSPSSRMFEINAASKKKVEGKKPKAKKLGRKQRAQLSLEKKKRKREEVVEEYDDYDGEEENNNDYGDDGYDLSEEEEREKGNEDQRKLKKGKKPDLSSAFQSVFTTVSQKHAASSSGFSKPTRKAEHFEKVGINQLLIRGASNANQNVSSSSNNKNLTKLQLKFQKKLEGARFRALNEQLYSTKGEESFISFQHDPHLFEVYHEGFRKQVTSWPTNPLDMIIKWINQKHPNKVIADMGCGDAQLALKVKNKVHSFDLVSVNERVTACDISNLPIKMESVDIVVFCLSLMGTNIGEFLREAHRVLRPKGHLKIAEVRSRFEGEKDGIKKFIRALKKAGFDCSEKNFENKMFFMLECTKSARTPIFDTEYSAKVCHYKKR